MSCHARSFAVANSNSAGLRKSSVQDDILATRRSVSDLWPEPTIVAFSVACRLTPHLSIPRSGVYRSGWIYARS